MFYYSSDSEISSSIIIELSRVTFGDNRESFSRMRTTFVAFFNTRWLMTRAEGNLGDGSSM